MSSIPSEQMPAFLRGTLGRMLGGAQRLITALATVAGWVAPAAARIALAVPFLRSGLTKWNGFLDLSPTAQFLFEEQFKLHLFGRLYDFPIPDVLAWIDSVAEVVLPSLLIVGLATRFSALGILIMTAVIQLTVPEGWANFHLSWAALALAVLALGPGPASLDHGIARAFARRVSRPQSSSGRS